VQPITGQLACVFGRRHVALFVVSLYVLGSGIAGGANASAMLLGGRALQGAGSGGMTAMMGIIISDLVPLRLRSSYQAILAITYAVGLAIGPIVGGLIIQNTTWRWVSDQLLLDVSSVCVEMQVTNTSFYYTDLLHQSPHRRGLARPPVAIFACQVGQGHQHLGQDKANRLRWQLHIGGIHDLGAHSIDLGWCYIPVVIIPCFGSAGLRPRWFCCLLWR